MVYSMFKQSLIVNHLLEHLSEQPYDNANGLKLTTQLRVGDVDPLNQIYFYLRRSCFTLADDALVKQVEHELVHYETASINKVIDVLY